MRATPIVVRTSCIIKAPVSHSAIRIMYNGLSDAVIALLMLEVINPYEAKLKSSLHPCRRGSNFALILAEIKVLFTCYYRSNFSPGDFRSLGSLVSIGPCDVS